MADQEKPKYNIVLIPEDQVTQMSESMFEPGRKETLVFVKIVTMNQPCIKNHSHNIASAFGQDKGYLVFGECDEVRRFLLDMFNETMDQAKKDSELNP